MAQKKKALVLLSGGIDSVVSLWWAKKKGWDISTLNFFFPGQRKKEIWASQKSSSYAKTKENIKIELPFIESPRAEKACFIPQRNLIFYGIAASIAEQKKMNFILGGHIEHDAKVFPDAKNSFFNQMNRLIKIGAKKSISPRLIFPLIGMSKKEVIELGDSLDVPFEHTWSCSHDIKKHCWKCKSCLERLNGFREAKIKDPLWN